MRTSDEMSSPNVRRSMSWRGVGFLEVWLDRFVPCTEEANEVVRARMAERLASQLASDAAREGLLFRDLNLGPYSAATLILKTMAAPRDDHMTMPQSRQPFFHVW